jgi:cytochrome P450
MPFDFDPYDSTVMDPPDHTRMRKLLNHGFTSTAIADFRPKV